MSLALTHAQALSFMLTDTVGLSYNLALMVRLGCAPSPIEPTH